MYSILKLIFHKYFSLHIYFSSKASNNIQRCVFSIYNSLNTSLNISYVTRNSIILIGQPKNQKLLKIQNNIGKLYYSYLLFKFNLEHPPYHDKLFNIQTRKQSITTRVIKFRFNSNLRYYTNKSA